MKIDKSVLKRMSLCAVILTIIGAFLWVKNQEINFCRAVLGYLVNGSPVAEKFIDWESFKAVGTDVGAAYRNLNNEKEKADYRTAFIRSFSVGFRQAKGQLNAFSHWRIYDKANLEVVVACDYLGYNKTLLFTISKLGKKQLTSLQWEDAR